MKARSSRRSFLLSAAAFPALRPPAARSTTLPFRPQTGRPQKGDDEAAWDAVRARFAFSEERVPMNAANLCPSSREVADEVTARTLDIDRDCSFQNRAKLSELTEQARATVAQLLRVSGDEIALVRNTSEGNNIVNNGLDLGPGDRVVIWDQNHPTNNVAWKVRAKRFGFAIDEVSTPPDPADEGELLEPFVAALGPQTRVLAITHVSNVSGVRLPVSEIAAVTRRRGVWLHVDGAQTWGALDLDLRALGPDSFAASAHKWPCGPKEVGLLYVRRERLERLWPGVVAPSWGADTDPDPEGARRLESLGQRDDAALAGLGVAAEMHRQLGPRRIEERVVELASSLKGSLADSGLQLVTPRSAELSAGVCIVAVPAEQRRTVFDRLYREHGIAGAPTGGLRLCPHIYNTREHLRRAVAGIEAMRSLIRGA